MNKKDEFYIAEPAVRKTWLILVLLYIALLLWLEPLIDLFLSFRPPQPDEDKILAYNEQKMFIATISFGILRSLPVLMFIWFGWQSLRASRLPPKNIKLPFSIRIVSGPQARAAGMFIIATGLLLLLREINQFNQVSPLM